MKSTGIVRHVDNLDRIVIPKELCKTLEIGPKEAMEIFINDTQIILQKHIEDAHSSAEKTTGNSRFAFMPTRQRSTYSGKYLKNRI